MAPFGPHEDPLTLTAWLERLDELAIEGGIELPLDLSVFEPHYRAGQAPINALEEYTTGRVSF